ncbi:MAG: phosphotransferase [Candidatus Hydrogenedentes bacterium]|nr:phosphotransferase [Candidatus Hydrogenedentota bacterium]
MSVSVKLGGMGIIQKVIEERYDFTRVDRPEQLETTHQRRHRKMTVETDQGKFLVKTYSCDPVILDNLRFQHHLSDHLARNGLPVAGIKRAKDGKGIVQVDNWAMELQHFVHAGAMIMSSAALTASAHALGRFHEVCRDVPVPPRDSRMWRFSEVPRESLKKFVELAQSTTRRPEMVLESVNVLALFLKDAADHLSMEKRSTFENGLIHGDWHGGNLMYDGDELKAIVDLEFAGDGCYLEDIAYAVSNLCIRTTTNEEKMRHRTNILLDNYQIHRTLSYGEQVALFYAVGVKHITTVSYQAPQHGGIVAGYTAAEWLERLALQCKWLREEARRARWGQ